MDIITKLREPKIQINDNLELSIFDLTASYLGVYFVSKYIFNISRPALTSAVIFLPISYFTHEYFQIETPFNNFINGKTKDKPDVKLVEAPLDNNIQLPPIDFKTMDVPTQMYIQQRTESKNQVFDEENNLMQPVKYEKLR
jgi:hypothetical protein